MQLPPGLYPRERSRPTESNAEIRVYESLKPRMPPGWFGWHSLRLEDDGLFGEGDFVIADPDRGLLVLEVKGGKVEQKDGRWFQNGAPMSADPRTQAYQFLNKLISRLEREKCRPPAYGIATCFPDITFDKAPGQADLSRTTIGGQDLP